MRTSSNPAFRNLPTGQGGYAGFDRMGGAASGAAAYGYASAPTGYGRSSADQRSLTVDDVVTKTAITAAAALVAGVLTALSGLYILVLPAFLVGLVVALIIIFRQSSNPALVLTYSIAEGIALGGITGALEHAGTRYAGIGAQAVIGTAGVFVGMLVVYKTGAVKVTPRFTKWLMGAMVGVLVLMLANFVGNLFGADLGLRSGGTIAIVFSLLCIGVAAFSLLLDFDQADQAIRVGAPARTAWYIAFGLMTALVWLYLEILRLLTYFREQ